MKLLTKEIERKLLKTGSTDGKDPKDIPIIVKFFSPYSGWTWYTVSGEKREDGDWEFFGLVRGFENELGSFCLSELDIKKAGVPLVERDMYFGEHTLAEAMENPI
jgi:hypothetical protein